MLLPHAALLLVAALASACTTGAPGAPVPAATPTPAASASPVALPSALPAAPSALPTKQAFFGPVTAKRTATESVIIVRAGEDPAKKTFGLATIRYITVEGVEHAVHWDHATVHDALTTGETVNVHPTDQVVGKQEGGGQTTYQTLMKLYRGSRRQDPIEVLF